MDIKNRSISCDFRSNYSCWKEFVSDFNRKWASLMIPVEVMMCLFMVVGLIGNILVLFIYSCRRQKTTATIFIMFLASIDLFACAVLHPYIIYKQFHNYDQTWTNTCKLLEFFIHCSLSLSCLALLLVAIDRFLAICRPVKFLLFDKHVVKAIALVTAIAVVISLPILEFYGAAPDDIMEFDSNFTGFKCHYKVQYQNSAILTAFGAFVMGGFLIEIVTMGILYKHVAVTAYRSRRVVRPLSNAHILAGIQPSVSSDSRNSSRRTQCSEIKEINGKPSSSSSENNVFTLKNMSRFTSKRVVAASRYSAEREVPTETNRSEGFAQGLTSPFETREDVSENRNLSPRLKAAKILGFVTAVFFLSWMPFFIMRICTTVNSNFWGNRSETSYIIEHLLNHVFYLNNAANPIIYTVINRNFRKDCKKVFKKHCTT